MIVHGILVCNSFLISVCMFIVWKASFISSATVIVRAGGAIWLDSFVTVLFNVCSAATVECRVLSRVPWETWTRIWRGGVMSVCARIFCIQICFYIF